MADFSSGIELCRRFYEQEIRPAISSQLAGLPHAAALLGRGSEVLGFDDEVSRDHDWKPRAVIFLEDHDEARAGEVEDLLRGATAQRFEGYKTDLSVTTIRAHLQRELAIDLDRQLSPTDWLTLSEQRLRSIAGGTIYHDEVGLTDALARISYYPDGVWRYLMIAGWWRIHPEANLVGRTGQVGDELGSELIAAELVDAMMRLCFLLEREYAPYAKWFGTAFSRLNCAQVMLPILERVLASSSTQDREAALNDGYRELAALHNGAGITEPVPTGVVRMWDRPFGVLWGDFPGALRQTIDDPEVLRIVELWPTGAVDRVREWIWPTRYRDRLIALVGPT